MGILYIQCVPSNYHTSMSKQCSIFERARWNWMCGTVHVHHVFCAYVLAVWAGLTFIIAAVHS